MQKERNLVTKKKTSDRRESRDKLHLSK